MAKRGKGNSIVVYIIVGLICFAMIGFGATNFGGSVNAIGQVGNRDISAQRYFAALTNSVRQLSELTGQPVTLAQAQAIGLDQQALSEVVSTVALENEAAEQGISVGDAAVAEQILAIPAFQGLDGQFDRERYSQSLVRNGLTERSFEDDLRAELSRTILQGAVSSGVAAPEPLVATLMEFIGERRSVTWLSQGAETLTEPLPEPSEDDLRAYFKANEPDFMLPETRRITYIWLTPAMMAGDMVLEEADLRALYDQRSAEFNQPERRLVERLILGADAEAAKARLDAGEITFEALVAERELELSDIDLGDVTEAELEGAGAAVFATEGPGIVGPVETALGAALFRVNAVLAAQETSFEDALPELEEELGLEEAARVIGDEIELVDDLLAGGATLEEVAAETDLVLETIDWSVESSGGISDYAAFRRAAAALTADDFPEVMELDDGGLFAFRLEEVIDPRLQDFADARAAARVGWEAEATIAALTEAAAPIVATLEEGGTPAAVTPATETELTRDAFIPGASPQLITALFEMAPGEVRVVPGENAVEILRLDEVLPPDLEDETMASRRDRLAQVTAQSIGGDILAAFATAVQNQAGITLDQAAIQAVNVNLP